MARRYRPRLERAPSSALLITIPVVSVCLGSMTTIFPVIATAPLLPPCGLLLLIGWRFLVRDLWPAWAGLPLGFFDDLFSGQPLGSAACIWTVLLLLMELFDRRMMWRDYKQDWRLGSALMALAIVMGLAFANLSGGGTTLPYIMPQIVISALCLPLAIRICAVLDRFRWRL
jgi:rod shape-determining protein MreD